MSEVLTGPVIAAAVLLCIAGVGKLREPAGAARALSVLGLPARSAYVRALAVVEIGVGIGVLVAPAAASLAVLAGLYGTFAGAGAVLRARGAGCGCFGGGVGEVPASVAQVVLSGTLAIVCAAGAAWPEHGVGWAAMRPALALGIAGCVYALVLVYTQLPVAWGAWGAR